MAVDAKLRLQISQFKSEYTAAKNHAKKESAEMRREAGGVGESLTKGVDNLKARVAGMLGGAAIVATMKGALTRADDLADLKIALNETADTLQRVDYAAQQTASMGVEQVAKAFLKLEKNLGDLDNTAAADAMDHLGLSAGRLMGMPLDEKLLTLSEAFQTARENGTGVTDLMDLLGRSGGELIPMLGQSKESLEALFADAPVMAEEMIDQMAILNDQLDGSIAKTKTGAGQVTGAWAAIGQFAGDVMSTGSVDDAMLAFADRDLASTLSIQRQRDAKAAQEEAIDASRKMAEATKAEEEAAEKLKTGLEKLAELKERLANDEINLLPDDAKVDALKAKLDKMLADTVGNFSLKYETSAEGLEKLARARDARTDLPASGVNSAAEAFEWLAEVRKLEADIAKTEEKILGDKEKARADEVATQDRLEAMRAEAEEGRAKLLSGDEQAQLLRDQLSESLAIDISGAADVERGLQRLRTNAEVARINGDAEAEAAALAELKVAQAKAAEFAGLAKGDDATSATVSGRGTVAGAIANIFGRSSSDLQLDESKAQTGLLQNINRVLAEIRDADTRDAFGEPTFRYP
jgi:hypothetical protein